MTTKAQKYRGGRRSKYTPQTVSRVIKAIESGLPIGLAVIRAGIVPSTFHQWRQRHQDFDQQVEAAQLIAIDSRLGVIENAAKMGDWRAAAWLLERANSEFFSKNRIEHTHQHVGVSFTIPASTLDEISKARRDYERKVIDVQTDAQAT